MRPEKFSDSDADLNIGMAIAGIQSLSNGIYIAMHGLIIPYDQIDRDKKSGQYRLSHHVDLKTGIYNGKQILEPKK